MAFVWVIAGVVYVLYQLYKEDKVLTKTFFWVIGLFIAWGSIPWLIANALFGETVANIVQIIVFVVPLLIMCICAIAKQFSLKLDKPSRIVLSNNPKDRVLQLQEEFRKMGHNVYQEDIEKYLVQDPFNPLRDGNTPIAKCYYWLCGHKSWEIFNYNRAEMEKLLNVKFDSAPLDKSLPTAEAYLKQTIASKQYYLKQRGLEYRDLFGEVDIAFSKYLNDEKYQSEFDEYITQYINEHH